MIIDDALAQTGITNIRDYDKSAQQVMMEQQQMLQQQVQQGNMVEAPQAERPAQMSGGYQ
jgi:hypothetical protein